MKWAEHDKIIFTQLIHIAVYLPPHLLSFTVSGGFFRVSHASPHERPADVTAHWTTFLSLGVSLMWLLSVWQLKHSSYKARLINEVSNIVKVSLVMYG